MIRVENRSTKVEHLHSKHVTWDNGIALYFYTSTSFQASVVPKFVSIRATIAIESMLKMHHIEILKIIKKDHNIKINENKSGVFINLSFLPQYTIDEILQYINYISDQENCLKSLETQKDDFKNTFFNRIE